jgi:hypothetical protein
MPTPEEIALQRIRAAAEGGNTALNLSWLAKHPVAPGICFSVAILSSPAIKGLEQALLSKGRFRNFQLGWGKSS